MKPRAGQLYKAPSPRLGERFIRVVEVRSGGGDGGYVNVREVTAEGKAPRPSKAHPFRRETFSIALNAGGVMPPPYTPVKEDA